MWFLGTSFLSNKREVCTKRKPFPTSPLSSCLDRYYMRMQCLALWQPSCDPEKMGKSRTTLELPVSRNFLRWDKEIHLWFSFVLLFYILCKLKKILKMWWEMRQLQPLTQPVLGWNFVTEWSRNTELQLQGSPRWNRICFFFPQEWRKLAWSTVART